ncbi:MAG: DUF4351 domain-containing protein [Aphanocapsa sp. GSE-SYN-MK-11-07L]|nr:DUF4351 domain-containing protein [Aphanocapsa sp. GSE-SYN-MK-11-07L]
MRSPHSKQPRSPPGSKPRSRISTLCLEQLENLDEALLEFEALAKPLQRRIADLEQWFRNLEERLLLDFTCLTDLDHWLVEYA